MSVRAILKIKGYGVVTVGSHETLRDVVATLNRERVGAVVVSDDGATVAGIVSERDIIGALAEYGAALLELTASDIMTKSVSAARIDMNIDQVLDIMTQGRFRHMPVLENGRLAGLVSIGDAVKARLEMLENETVQLKEYIGGR
jgi:CBS domain-containing protein